MTKALKKFGVVLSLLFVGSLVIHPDITWANPRSELFQAIQENNLEGVQKLLSAPLRVSKNNQDRFFFSRCAVKSTEHGDSLFTYAVRQGNLDIVKEIAHHSNPYPDKSGSTPLLVAAELGHTQIVEYLLPISNPVNKKNSAGETPLWVAVRERFPEIVKLLLSAPDVNMNIVVRSTHLLELAINQGDLEILEMLLDRGALSQTKPIYQRNLLIKAVEVGDPNLIKLLLKHHIAIDLQDSLGGKTALFYSVEWNRPEIVELLLRNHANPNIPNFNSKIAPLHRAAEMGFVDIATLLLKAGADPNRKGQNGATPLSFAAFCDHPVVAQVLLDFKAEIDLKDDEGDTPLMYAVISNNRDMVEFLLAHGANPNKSNYQFMTPLYKAEEYEFREGKRLLLESKAVDFKKQAFYSTIHNKYTMPDYIWHIKHEYMDKNEIKKNTEKQLANISEKSQSIHFLTLQGMRLIEEAKIFQSYDHEEFSSNRELRSNLENLYKSMIRVSKKINLYEKEIAELLPIAEKKIDSPALLAKFHFRLGSRLLRTASFNLNQLGLALIEKAYLSGTSSSVVLKAGEILGHEIGADTLARLADQKKQSLDLTSDSSSNASLDTSVDASDDLMEVESNDCRQSTYDKMIQIFYDRPIHFQNYLNSRKLNRLSITNCENVRAEIYRLALQSKTPDFIRLTAELLGGVPLSSLEMPQTGGLCSATDVSIAALKYIRRVLEDPALYENEKKLRREGLRY